MKKKIIIIIIFFLFIFLFLFFILVNSDIILQSESGNIKIFDKNGVLLYEIPGKSKFYYSELQSLQDLNDYTLEAFIITEDKTFWDNIGIDIFRMTKVIWENIILDQKKGASTISMQLVKNKIHQNKDRNIKNKLIEIIYAININLFYNKEDILKEYLNNIYFGNLVYGIETASNFYFSKSAKNLSIGESAFLASIIQNPSIYNPLVNFDNTIKRKNIILNLMYENNIITKKQLENSINMDIKLNIRDNIKAPHFVRYVISYLQYKNPEYFKKDIHTTLDYSLQKKVESIVNENLERFKKHNVNNASVFVVNKKGEIIVFLGSKDFYDTSIDGNVNNIFSYRQPGSVLKPLTYLLALSQGYKLSDPILDTKTSFFSEYGNYAPKNFSKEYYGLVFLKDALASSLNVSAVKVLSDIGEQNLFNLLMQFNIKDFGMDSKHFGLGLTLGSMDLRLYDLVKIYLAFLNYGEIKDIIFLDIENNTKKEILNSELFYLITYALFENEAKYKSFGMDNVLAFGDFQVASKTGTSRNFRDNWVIGYNPCYVVGVWVGNNDAIPMDNISGIEGAGPIFRDVMNLLNTNNCKTFHIPENIVFQDICWPSGKLPSQYCINTTRMPFEKSNIPKEYDDMWEYENGRNYIKISKELESWAIANNINYKLNFTDEKLRILEPYHNDVFKITSRIPFENQKIKFFANQDDINWYINGEWKSNQNPFYIFLEKGEYEVIVRDQYDVYDIRIKIK